MPNHADVTQDLQHALSLVNPLVEGGIDPFASPQAEATLRALIDAQEALEEAARCWRRPVRHRTKKGAVDG
jgi:hypothetical protein